MNKVGDRVKKKEIKRRLIFAVLLAISVAVLLSLPARAENGESMPEGFGEVLGALPDEVAERQRQEALEAFERWAG